MPSDVYEHLLSDDDLGRDSSLPEWKTHKVTNNFHYLILATLQGTAVLSQVGETPLSQGVVIFSEGTVFTNEESLAVVKTWAEDLLRNPPPKKNEWERLGEDEMEPTQNIRVIPSGPLPLSAPTLRGPKLGTIPIKSR
jgi:hypothetical protein